MTRTHFTATIAISALAIASPAWATTEICGNATDDDGNGLTDEGCYPAMTTGVCESPLSCGDTGMISWSTGSLHYDLPPDINPAVPYGPSIGLRRFFTSQHQPQRALPGTINTTPLGPGWQHTYLTYLWKSGTHATVHTSQGRDVYYTFASTAGGWDSYTAQVGEHVMSLKHRTTSPNEWRLQLITGETIVYNSSGQLIEIWDTLGPTPNKVLVTWDSTSRGNVSTVTDANGRRRLLFGYTNGLMTSVKFQTKDSGGTWNTQHTTSYGYSGGVTQDATSAWFVPASASEWTTLLSGSGLSNPSSLWLMQESSGNLADSIGTATVTMTGGTYQVSASGWSRKGVKLTDGSTGKGTATTPNASTTSLMLVQFFSINTNPAATRGMNRLGATQFEDAELAKFLGHPNPRIQAQSGSNTSLGAMRGGTLLVVTKLDHSRSEFALYDGLGDGWVIETLKPTFTNQSADTFSYIIGNGISSSDSTLLYSALFTGTAAELSDTQVATLVSRIQGSLTSVTIGGQLAQTMTYDGNNVLTKISDGSGNLIVAFGYDSAATGKVVRADTPRGTVGFDYSPSRTGCSTAGHTLLYFNKGNASSCSVDADCGTGFMCGGKTGSGSTGTCFLAARCMTTSTVNGESVITNVDPIGAGGGTCSGACTDVAQYAWDSGTSWFNVVGRKDPLANYSSVVYCLPTDGSGCTVGLPKVIGYGDTDTNPTSGANRVEFRIYDTVFPGRIKEIRRPSDLSASRSSCAWNNTAGCQRTIYSYDATTNQLTSIENDGYTWDATGSTETSYRSIITYSHDSKGRVSEIDGAITGIKTIFDYLDSNTDPNLDYFLGDTKMYYDTTHYLQPQITSYDFWGHPTALKAPDGNFTCDTYDSARGYLSSRRHAMNGQTDCTTTNGADITASWTRDSNLRLTQLTRPDGSCLFYSYDSSGRLNQSKRRDDCNSSSSGDTQTWNYTADSQISEVDTYDASSTLTAKQPYTYFNSRRMQNIVNPVDTSKFTGLVYDSAGKVAEVDGASSLSKAVYHFDGAPGRDGRVSSEERFVTSSTSDTWSLLYSWIGGQSQVTDGDSKVTGSARDDMNRLVKLTSPDFTNDTRRVFDTASRLTTIVEDKGGGVGNEQTHTFTFDNLSRPLNTEYQGTCPTGTPHPELMRVYDALPGGTTCPATMTGGCNNLAGRLAWVKVTLLCSSTYSATDGALDQVTYFSYDKAGRLVEEYITDDAGRTADHLYQYTKNGVLSQITTPTGSVIGWTFGSAGNNSDTDLISGMWQTSSASPVLESVASYPFGPLKGYTQENTSSSIKEQTLISRNLAYRVTEMQVYTSGGDIQDVFISEDAKGRVTLRDYYPNTSGIQDSNYFYDEQDRVTCETAGQFSTCQASGNKNNHDQTPTFMSAGDWKRILRPIAGTSPVGYINDLNSTGTTYGMSHQVTDVNQTDGTPAFGHTALGFDVRGNRSYDDNTTTNANDRRDYTYDARRNVVNVRGQYKTGGSWHYYDVASAFDSRNRRVYKSFYDETTAKTANWFFYYDVNDRLTEIRYTPDISSPSTYSVFQLFWLDQRITLYVQTDYPSATITKRYVDTDETDRPIDMICWAPGGANCGHVWTTNPSAWGVDANVLGPTVFQPILLGGQYQDSETVAEENDGVTTHRPGVALNGFRTYDPFIGAYLQIDPAVDHTWSTYLYAASNPIGRKDVYGLDGTTCTNSMNCVCQSDPDSTFCLSNNGEHNYCDNGKDCSGNGGDSGGLGDIFVGVGIFTTGFSVWGVCCLAGGCGCGDDDNGSGGTGSGGGGFSINASTPLGGGGGHTSPGSDHIGPAGPDGTYRCECNCNITCWDGTLGGGHTVHLVDVGFLQIDAASMAECADQTWVACAANGGGLSNPTCVCGPYFPLPKATIRVPRR